MPVIYRARTEIATSWTPICIYERAYSGVQCCSARGVSGQAIDRLPEQNQACGFPAAGDDVRQVSVTCVSRTRRAM
jgi:hypothetical protein